MMAVAIVRENVAGNGAAYRAMAAGKQSVGHSPGEALDALTSQLSKEETGALIIVQNLRADHRFDDQQQQRMSELMTRWRSARAEGKKLSEDEASELQGLIDVEVNAAGRRALTLLEELGR